MRSNHAALVDDSDEEECNRVGSVFAKFLCVSRRDAVSVAEECPLFQHAKVLVCAATCQQGGRDADRYRHKT
jgi:hypothetical protein